MKSTRPRHAKRFGQRLVAAGKFPPRAVYELAGGKDYEGDLRHFEVAKALCAMFAGLRAASLTEPRPGLIAVSPLGWRF